MAGVTDAAYRTLMRRYGADLTYTEMVSASGLQYDNRRTWEMLTEQMDEESVGVQLFGHDPDVLADQARRVEDLLQERLAVIDVNMACPVKKVLKNGDGSALLHNPSRAASIVSALKAAVSCPVSVKMRISYTQQDELGRPFACALAEAGVDGISIHGRSATQLYRGSSSHERVAQIFSDLNNRGYTQINRMVSGDIFSAQQAYDALRITKANGVMIARGSQGNPFIFEQTKALLANGDAPNLPTLQEKLDVAHEHCQLFFAAHGHIPRLRKVLGWYVSGFPQASMLRAATSRISTREDVDAFFCLAQQVLEA